MRCPTTQILAVLFSILFFYAPVQPADKIRISYPGLTTAFIPLQLAQSKGFLKDDGIDAEYIHMAGNVPISALVNGDIDYNTAILAGVRAAIQGLPLKIVACYVPTSSTMLIAHPEFKTVRELKGKTIGIQSFGGNLNVQANMILRHFGLDYGKGCQISRRRSSAIAPCFAKAGLYCRDVRCPPDGLPRDENGFRLFSRRPTNFSAILIAVW